VSIVNVVQARPNAGTTSLLLRPFCTSMDAPPEASARSTTRIGDVILVTTPSRVLRSSASNQSVSARATPPNAISNATPTIDLMSASGAKQTNGRKSGCQ
jgi:hypothetical protein